MTARPVRRSSLFLLELMTAILFFCLCTGCCVQMFTRARRVSIDSAALTRAVRQCSNAAELFRSTGNYHLAFTEEYPDGVWIEDTDFEICFDPDWQTCPKEDASYLMRITLTPVTGSDGAKDNTGSNASPSLGSYDEADPAPSCGCLIAAMYADGTEIYQIYTENYRTDTGRPTAKTVSGMMSALYRQRGGTL